ncbi:MAG TPA: ATP-binding cassette domain-containing protein, partial [Blastocatellia bacterium]|nr:ATP-binding cassette domain-containing protein [Blastocatellia bacterium]
MIAWRKCLLTGVCSAAASLTGVTLVISVYAMMLVAESGGAPDRVKLKSFAAITGGWGMQVSVVLFTFVAAAWVARRTTGRAALHGALVGLSAALAGGVIGVAFGDRPSTRGLISFAVILTAGWLGGAAGDRQIWKRMNSVITIKPNPAPHVNSDEPPVRVRNLCKHYGEVRAVDDVSFEVARGEVFGLLGPNGAGKTTTVEIIEGLRQADGGEVRVCGLDPGTRPDEVKERIGVAMQTTALPDKIRLREALQLFAGFYRWRSSPEELLALVELEDKANATHESLSEGQKQRLAIALALINDPSVVILDEPTAGLDPQARLNLHGVIRQLRDRGKTVLLTTHYIDEAEKLCDRVAIMDHGKIIAFGAPRE